MISRISRAYGTRSIFFCKEPPKGFERFFKRRTESKKERSKDSNSSSRRDWRNFNDPDPKNWRPLIVLAGGLTAYYILRRGPETPPVVSMQELMNEYISMGKVQKIAIELPEKKQEQTKLTNIYVHGRDQEVLAMLKIPDMTAFLNTLEAEQYAIGIEKKGLVPVEFKEQSKTWNEYTHYFAAASHFLVNFALMGTLAYMMYKSGGGNAKNGGGSKGGGSGGWGGGLGDLFNMNRHNFKVYGVDNKKIEQRFSDVAGLYEAKREIMEFVDFLKAPEKFTELGARIPRGALLVGPPGTGKTLLAKAAAGEASVPFFSISGSEFVEMFVGVGASRVRELFKQARERAPSIIFIDEIDAVGKKRHGRVGGNDERDNTLNQLLVEMDGFGTDTHVVILAGTNRKDILDSALLRPGRFDRTIDLTLPDLEARQEILKIHLKPLRLSPETSLEEYSKRLAALSPGFSGADLANLCNEAAITAARHDKEYVDKADFESASERVLGGLEKSKKLSGKERSIVAHHEAGHAVAGWFLKGADPILKVSILPRSKGALGFAQFLPNELMLHSQSELCDKICAILGGRVAEELFFERVTTGAQDDLQKATGIASALVTSFGMNKKMGYVGYTQDQESVTKPFSEDTNRIIDEEVRQIINECLERTRVLLASKKHLIEQLANMLLEKERVVHKDLLTILGERPFEPDQEYKKYLEEDK